MVIKTIQDLHQYDPTSQNLTKQHNTFFKQALDNSMSYINEPQRDEPGHASFAFSNKCN